MPDRPPPALDAPERETLVAFLDYLRSSVLAKLAGVPESEAKEARVPSGTSLYWLATHLSAVEINQFQRILDGRDDADLVPPPPAVDDTLELALGRYQRACAESREILESFPDFSSSGRGRDRRTGDTRTVRWVLVHMIEETARHLGHLDILREQTDGAVGR